MKTFNDMMIELLSHKIFSCTPKFVDSSTIVEDTIVKSKDGDIWNILRCQEGMFFYKEQNNYKEILKFELQGKLIEFVDRNFYFTQGKDFDAYYSLLNVIKKSTSNEINEYVRYNFYMRVQSESELLECEQYYE